MFGNGSYVFARRDRAATGAEEAQKELVRAWMEYNRIFAARDEFEKVKR